VLSDAPMLQGLIDTELSYGLDLESDDQLLLGDGTNQNVLGLLVDTDVSDVAPDEATVALADLGAAYIDHIRKAVTTLQTFEYYNINGITLNPVDWQTIETAKATDGHYLLVPFAATNAEATQLWRVPVVLTNAQPQGTFLMGDWTMGAVLYDREDASIRISEHHADNFIKNAVTILGEERYAFAIPRPKAFAKGEFPTVTGAS
jgi:HK97 family phage major capsid protein